MYLGTALLRTTECVLQAHACFAYCFKLLLLLLLLRRRGSHSQGLHVVQWRRLMLTILIWVRQTYSHSNSHAHARRWAASSNPQSLQLCKLLWRILLLLTSWSLRHTSTCK